MSLTTAILLSGLIQGGLLWGAIRVLDPSNSRNKPIYAVLIGLFLAITGLAAGVLWLLPLCALGWLLVRGYELDIARTVGVLVLLALGNWGVAGLLERLVASVGLGAVQALLLAAAGAALGRWLWLRRGPKRTGEPTDAAEPVTAIAREARRPAKPAPPPPTDGPRAPHAGIPRRGGQPPAPPAPPAASAAQAPKTAAPQGAAAPDEPRFLR